MKMQNSDNVGVHGESAGKETAGSTLTRVGGALTLSSTAWKVCGKNWAVYSWTLRFLVAWIEIMRHRLRVVAINCS